MKQVLTFDQLLNGYLQQKLEALSNGKEFELINDVSLFQEEDKIEGKTIILLRTYGGERTSLPDLDATPLTIQLLLNTDEPQFWKRVLTSLINDINGKWNEVSFSEDEEFEDATYYFMPTLNNPTVQGTTTQVGISTRYNLIVYGSFFYTSDSSIALYPEIKMEIDGNYLKVPNIVTVSFGYSLNTETMSPIDNLIFKQEIRGVIRTFNITFYLNLKETTHKELVKTFFNNSDIAKAVNLQITVDDLTLDSSFYIDPFSAVFTFGDGGTVQLTFVESGE